ncbi:MAG: cob(I)yrinic acid a,c-diamide adenosyltransferase [Epulopiscium sp.]|nr:cob(I)yrinic acid a,c-diamide adenosyltransferase [Candidatus Epulonipiscium sp.]HOQ17302.1 cob(I)yrinic acid a,c-diamide adenosyltransferase [Defluviitaleaceae bacterium]HPT76343.1 cob(I)yrinic acid a,c-diamide adenosyltransferase [Defluviitaleaceae bacterium]
MEKGLIQVYCGDGKGKTTAAIGQGIRAVGQGLKVIMIQFLKIPSSGEINVLKNLEPDFKIFHFERPRRFFWELNEEEKNELKNDILNGINFAKKVLDTKECDMLILDEILGVIENSLFEEDELCRILDNKPDEIEIILTGRKVTEKIEERAHYVSWIQEKKHPFQSGIKARKGIEY